MTEANASKDSGSRVLRVGLVGAGIIGNVHRAAYDRHPNAEVVALADPRGQEVLRQQAAGYVPGSKDTGDLRLPVYSDLEQMLSREQLDIIDICTPTPSHRDPAIRALEAGKHVLLEKPMGRTLADCDAILAAARRAPGKLMIAHCLRFWPVYEYLHEIVTSGRYGRVERGRFARQVITPPSGWFLDGKISGGAILDLHIHDVDTAAWVLGLPREVSAFGRIGPSGCHDQVAAVWHYEDDSLVLLDGFWFKAGPVPFCMSFEVAMDGATLTFDSLRDPAVQLNVPGDEPLIPQLDPADGYTREIDYFVRAIVEDQPIERGTPQSSRMSVALVEAEVASIQSGKRIPIVQ